MVVAALGTRQDPDAAVARDLWDHLTGSGKRVLIAAPTLAELLMGSDPVQLPRVHGVEVVAFDGDAAEWLAKNLPSAELKKWHATATAPPRHYLKYDAMIIACAARALADCLVTKDDGMANLASAAGLKAHKLEFFLSAQQQLGSGLGWTPPGPPLPSASRRIRLGPLARATKAVRKQKGKRSP